MPPTELARLILFVPTKTKTNIFFVSLHQKIPLKRPIHAQIFEWFFLMSNYLTWIWSCMALFDGLKGLMSKVWLISRYFFAQTTNNLCVCGIYQHLAQISRWLDIIWGWSGGITLRITVFSLVIYSLISSNSSSNDSPSMRRKFF